jgi:hypothetical protein
MRFAKRTHCRSGNFSAGHWLPKVFEVPCSSITPRNVLVTARKVLIMAKVTPIRPPRVGSRFQASRVTTGYSLFVESGDGRSAWARRWKDLIFAHAADLGPPETLSEAQISICRRVAATEIALEQLEARMSEGQQIDLDQYGRLSGRLCRMFELIGIQSLARPLDPQSALVQAFKGMAATPIDDDGDEDEPAPIEEGLDREPGEA